jgi:hypothetical protein
MYVPRQVFQYDVIRSLLDGLYMSRYLHYAYVDTEWTNMEI